MYNKFIRKERNLFILLLGILIIGSFQSSALELEPNNVNETERGFLNFQNTEPGNIKPQMIENNAIEIFNQDIRADATITFSRFFGGSASFGSTSSSYIDVDKEGNVYLATTTESNDFPTMNAFDPNGTGVMTGPLAATLSKFDANGYLVWSTYLKAAGWHLVVDDLVVDKVGNVIIVGWTGDTVDAPINSSVYSNTPSGGNDVFVAKFNSSGSLIWNTLIGGNADDLAHEVTVDSSNNILISGETVSSDYPTTTGVYDQTANGGSDAFITKLSSDGSTIIWSTFYGGSQNDLSTNIKVDANDDVFVVGSTISTDLPMTSDAFDNIYSDDGTLNGNNDVYLAKFDSTGSMLLYSTYLGDSGIDEGKWAGLAIDTLGNIIVTFESNSINFPTSTGAMSEVNNGGYDGILLKFNNTGTLLFSTYVGGSLNDVVRSVIVDDNDQIFISGNYASDNFQSFPAVTGLSEGFVAKINQSGFIDRSWAFRGSNQDEVNDIVRISNGFVVIGYTNSPDLPTTVKTGLNGNEDWFITKISSPLPDKTLTLSNSLVYSRVFGGLNTEHNWRPKLVVDNIGNVFVAGDTRSDDFPVINGIDHTYNPNTLGDPDMYVMKFDRNGYLLWSTYFGSSAYQVVDGIAIDSNGNIAVSGWTGGVDFPLTAGVYDTLIEGTDSFVVKFSSNGELLMSTFIGGTGEDRAANIKFDSLDNIIISGDTTSTNFPTTSPGWGPRGGIDYFIMKLNPTGTALLYSTVFGGSGSDLFGGLQVSDQGDIYFASQVDSTDLLGTTGAMNETSLGGADLYAGKIFTNGTLAWASFFGTGGNDYLFDGMYLDDNGNIHFTGQTDGSNFPVMGPQLPSIDGTATNGFYIRFDTNGQLLWSTLLGGSGDDNIITMDITSSNELIFAGGTSSTDFPLLYPIDNALTGVSKAFITKISQTGEILLSTYLGGNDGGEDTPTRLISTGPDEVMISGYTYDTQFPKTIENNGNLLGGADVFLVKFRHASLPDNVTDLSVTKGDALISLNWTEPAHNGAKIDAYSVLRSLTEFGTYTFLTNTSSTSYTDTTVVNGQTYYYKITTWNRVGESTSSNLDFATPSKTPSAPQNVNVQIASTTLTISWETPSSSGGSAIIGYNVYRSNSSGGPYNIVQNTLNATMYIDIDVIAGQVYFYVVTAVNSNGESPNSNEASGIPGTLPDTPTSLVATSVDYIILNWTAPADDGGFAISNYNVYRSIFAGGPYQIIATTSALSYVDSTTTFGTEYYYVVSAVNLIGESGLSNEVQITGTGSSTGIPSAPQQLVAKEGDGTVRLLWFEPQIKAGNERLIYTVYRGATSGNYQEITQTIATFFTDTTVINGKNYFYVVTAKNTDGESTNSNEVSLTPVAIPGAPTSLSATISNEIINLQWDVPINTGGADLLGYRIYRKNVIQIDFVLLTTTTTNTFVDTDVQNSEKLEYVITAFNQAGESAFSNQITVIPGNVADAPLNLLGTPGNNLGLLQWSAPLRDGGYGIQYYNIYRSTSSGSGFELLTTTTITSFSDSTAENGNTYYYVISAVNEIGESIFSNEVKVTLAEGETRQNSEKQGLPYFSFSLPILILLAGMYRFNKKTERRKLNV